MDLLTTIGAFLYDNSTGLLMAALLLSEALASIPQVQANSIFQLMLGVLRKRVTPTVVPVILAVLLLSACTSVHDLGGGRYIVPRVAEVRSPFGTNAGFVMLETCDGVPHAAQWSQPFAPAIDYLNCQGLTDWQPVSSQGQGGQIVQGVLTGIGLGVLGATMPGGSVSSSAVSSSTTMAPARGHH